MRGTAYHRELDVSLDLLFSVALTGSGGIEAIDNRPQAPEGAKYDMATEIRADMSASVWKVVAKVGDTVSDTDPIVILESMKMEVPVTSESSGVIAHIAVSEGENIKEGDLIARLD